MQNGPFVDLSGLPEHGDSGLPNFENCRKRQILTINHKITLIDNIKIEKIGPLDWQNLAVQGCQILKNGRNHKKSLHFLILMQ